jgi:hypothetical protein
MPRRSQLSASTQAAFTADEDKERSSAAAPQAEAVAVAEEVGPAASGLASTELR